MELTHKCRLHDCSGPRAREWILCHTHYTRLPKELQQQLIRAARSGRLGGALSIVEDWLVRHNKFEIGM